MTKLTDEQFDILADQFRDRHLNEWFEGDAPNGKPARMKVVRGIGGKIFWKIEQGPSPVRVGDRVSDIHVVYDVFNVDTVRRVLTYKREIRSR